MGVPKFFRWLYERYPCLCEVVREYQIPEFDNLYLDMNGIIHICSHPNDFDPHFRITEEKIFKDIFHYIEILFRMIQPKKLFFMAVDGVAPRAKLNQQRGRRFRTAKEALDLEKKAVDAGIELPKEERFDSNCITPGTEFMERLHYQLRYFIAEKMSHDKLWKNLKVILSGHETPGEGEHKIMDYIRYMKAQPNYDHNTRHCLYGLDADLIMLGLCCHEPHFSLLREEVKFNKKAKRASTPEGTKFYLLHLSLMRGYLDWEFHSLKDKLPFGYDLEKIIDDWVLMGFLVGNDFIPHLPGLHIANGALTILHKAYMDILPTLDGYINEGGKLVLTRFQRYMEKLAAFDINQFKDEYADLKYFEGKTNRKLGSKERPKFFEISEILEPLEPETPMDPKLEEMIKSTELQMETLTLSDSNQSEDLEQLFGGIEDDFNEEEDEDDDDEEESANAVMYQEFYQKKRDYYTNKLEFAKVTPEVLRSQAEGYVRAIQWNLNYYYNGVCSWSWFYPHHYAPYISDIKNFCDLDIKFDLGTPFLPFQQLLAVLPSSSKKLLPEQFHALMENENSPILDYYPSAFQTDLNGKRQEWEAVVLIPFIDEGRLLAAMEPLLENLTEEEKKRNKHGPMLEYTYSGKSVGTFEAPYFPTIINNHALEKRVMREDIYVPIEKLQKGLCSEVALDIHFPGFPTLRHVPHKVSLQKGKVKVFESLTRGESIIIQILTEEQPHWLKDAAQLAEKLLGDTFYLSWPHLHEAKIIEVYDKKHKYSIENSQGKGDVIDSSQSKKLSIKIEEKSDLWPLLLRSIEEHYNNSLGVQLGNVSIIVRALRLAGQRYTFNATGKVILEKQWNSIPEPFALQTVIKDIKVDRPKTPEYKTIHEFFPPKTVVFHLGVPHYGSLGQITEITQAVQGKGFKVRLSLRVVPEPNMDRIRAKLNHTGMKYYQGGYAAHMIGISGHLLSRITGTIYVSKTGDPLSKSTNIGLSLKYNKRNEEVPGFTKKDGNSWLYSQQCVVLLSNYLKNFPELFVYLSEHTDTNDFQETAIFPDSTNGSKLKEISEWLSQQPHSKVERRSCSAEVLDEEVVKGIEKEIESTGSLISKKIKSVSIDVSPNLVYKPAFKLGYTQPDESTTYFLYDRVVNVRECFTVPLGLRGTVIGIQRAQKQEDTLYDIVFDRSFNGGVQLLGCSPEKGYRLPAYSLVNLSHGERNHRFRNDAAVGSMNASKTQPAVYLPPGGGVLLRRQNQVTAQSSLSAHRGTPEKPASAFASWRSGCAAPAQPMPFKGKEILRRSTLEQSPRQSNFQGSKEFDAIMKEFQKNSIIGNSSIKHEETIKTSASYPLLMNASQGGIKCVESSEASTDILKKILRIDNSVSTPSLVSPNNIQPVSQHSQALINRKEISQPSVQDFFEKAIAVNAKQQEQNQKIPVSYCRELMSMFQRTGLGIPRYDYVTMENGMILAILALPNQKTMQGEPAPTKEMASESVAKAAIAQMSTWSKVDMQYGSMPMPANRLPAPPQQWCQPPPTMPQQQMHYSQYPSQGSWQNNIYQKPNWREHPDQSAELRRRQNPTQWHGNRAPQVPMFPQRFVPPQQHYQPFPPFQGHQQNPQWNSINQPQWRQPSAVKLPTDSAFQQGTASPATTNPFVPLQAVRAQMSANSVQVSSPKHHKHSQKQRKSEEYKSDSTVNKIAMDIHTTESPKKKYPAESKSKSEMHLQEAASSEGQNVSQESDKKDGVESQRSKEEKELCKKNKDTVKPGKQLYVPPHSRKSRLAIKFGP